MNVTVTGRAAGMPGMGMGDQQNWAEMTAAAQNMMKEHLNPEKLKVQTPATNPGETQGSASHQPLPATNPVGGQHATPIRISSSFLPTPPSHQPPAHQTLPPTPASQPLDQPTEGGIWRAEAPAEKVKGPCYPRPGTKQPLTATSQPQTPSNPCQQPDSPRHWICQPGRGSRDAANANPAFLSFHTYAFRL